MTIEMRDFVAVESDQPTWDYKMPDGQYFRVVKLEEDADMGYFYRVGIVTYAKQAFHVMGEGWFDGFGCDDRAHDVIHLVRAYVHAFHTPR